MKRLALVLLVSASVACVKSRPSEADAGAGSPPPTTTAQNPMATAAQPAATLAPMDTGVSFTVQQCEALLLDAERQASSARSRAQTECKTDDECELVETFVCVPGCNDRAIAKKAVPGYQQTRDQLRMTSCRQWNEAQCPRTTPKTQPACPPVKAACKAQHCEAVPK